MLHSPGEPSKAYRSESKDDWAGRDDFSFIDSTFYRIDALESAGFIHPDDSLHFQFFVKKHNYRRKVREALAKNDRSLRQQSESEGT